MADLSKFIRDAPPGELEAVRQDIEILTNKNHSVAASVAKEIGQYNVETFRIVTVEGRATVLSKFNQLSEGEFHAGGRKFAFDHATSKVSDVEAHKEPSAEATKLYKQVAAYVADHYPSESAFDVFDTAAGEQVVVIVGRRLSPQNYFNGQWASHYAVDGSSIKGEISVDIHYFEEGNVRLKSQTAVAESGSVVAAIEKAENKYETELNKALVGINENEFKALRRQLPVTRSQMVWGKAVAGYQLGRELENR